MKHLWIRAEAGPELGAGHLVRMRALAEALGPAATLLAGRNPMAERILAGCPRARWLGAAKTEAERLTVATAGDLVIFDLKGLAAETVAAQRQRGIATVVIEEAGPAAREAELLVDANRPATEARAPDREWFGPPYALLRPELLRRRREPRRETGPARILIALGGGRGQGTSCSGRDTGPSVDGGVHGAAAFRMAESLRPALPAACPLTVAGGWIPSGTVIPGVQVIAPGRDYLEQLAGCAILICAGGVTMWEGLGLGKAVVVVPTHAEQERNLRQWRTTVAATGVGDYERAVPVVARLAADPNLRLMMGHAGWEQVDGKGLDRLAAWCRARLGK